MHGLLHHLAGLGGKAQGRHDETVAVGDERAFAPFVLAAGNIMKHRHRRRDERRFGEACPDMFRRSLDGGVDRVQVESRRISHVAGHHRTLEKMDVVHVLDDPRCIIDVGKIGFAVAVGLDIDNMDGGASGAIMHPRSGEQHVVLRILPIKRDVPSRLGKHVVDKRAREADPPIITCNRAGGGHECDPRLRRLTEADFLEDLVHGLIDGTDRIIVKRTILATGEAGPNRTQLCGEWRRAFHAAGGPAAGTSRGCGKWGKQTSDHVAVSCSLGRARGAPALPWGRTSVSG